MLDLENMHFVYSKNAGDQKKTVIRADEILDVTMTDSHRIQPAPKIARQGSFSSQSMSTSAHASK